MQTEGVRKPWYRKLRYIVLLVLLLVVLVASFFPYFYHAPVSRNQERLNLAVDYMANSYNSTTGLLPEQPGGHTFWLYSDNYLGVLALERYDPSNSSTTGFASALNAALGGYLVTAPPNVMQNEYTALNSTKAYFACSEPYSIAWAQGGKLAGSSASTAIMSTANDLSSKCASENYADLYLLQAVYDHRLGNSSGSSYFYNKASTDFNGVGFTDLASNSTLYQTYKVALYVYASSCLGQTSSASYASAQTVLFGLQDNSTGGFYTGYTGPAQGSGSVNTETTTLAALAIEQVIEPSSSC